jgi:uncharacterized protein (DUF427 family)
MRATWNGAVLAESDDVVTVEGNAYFPKTAIECRYFEESDRHTQCHWKGEACYFDLVVDGQRNDGAAWYYPAPKPAAAELCDRVAFWRGVTVSP